jgi:hypothetical protein
MTERVTINDCRAAGYCVIGVRRHCATLGLDFRLLARDGLPLEEVEHIEDAAAQRIVAQAKRRIGGDGW